MSADQIKLNDSQVQWLGGIPAHWTPMRLRDSVESCLNGVWGDEACGDENDTPIIRVADFDRGGRRTFVHQTVRNVGEDQRKSRELVAGDLLIEKSGGGEQQSVGMVVEYTGPAGAVCSNFVARMRPREGVNSRYLVYVHAHLYSQGVPTLSIKQSTGIQNLDSTAYLGEQLYLPPLDEQIAIAAYLDAETARIDGLIDEKRKLLLSIDEMEAALRFELATRGLDLSVAFKPSGIEWVKAIPAHWMVKRNMFLFVQRREAGMEGLPILKVSLHTGVTEGEEDDEGTTRVRKQMEDKSAYQVVRSGDVAYNMMRAWQGAIGAVPIDGLVSPAYVVLEPSEELDGRYFEMLARTSQYMKDFERYSYGIASFRWRLYWEGFKEIRTPLPPINEQRRIVEAFEIRRQRFNDLRMHVEQELEALAELRSATITDAVLGRIDVREHMSH